MKVITGDAEGAGETGRPHPDQGSFDIGELEFALRKHGGHLLDVEADSLRLRLEALTDFHLVLPESEAFLKAGFSKTTAAQKTGQTGAQLVVRALENEGVTHVFGIPGAKIDAVFNALVDSKIKTVVCRHEQNGFIAGGVGRMTGKAGVAIATLGPGVSNLTTGLATANTERDPVVALGGSVATFEALKKVHQTMDAVSILKPVTKYCVSVGSPAQVSEVMATAFNVAESGRPGAAYVNLPIDVMAAPNPHTPLQAPAFVGLGPADGKAIGEAALLINAAKNPVVLVGMLASWPANAKALQAFLTNGRLPVVGTFQAAGAVGAPLFDNFGGRVGQIANQPGDRLLDSSDLVVTVGYDPVEYWPPEWNAGKTRKISHIDVWGTTQTHNDHDRGLS